METDTAVLEAVRAVWRGRLGVPGAFRQPGVHLHVRADEPGGSAGEGADANWWVAVVTLAGAACLSVPAAAARHAGAAALADRLRSPGGAAAAAGLLGPVVEVIGPAVLLYLDPARPDASQVPGQGPDAVAAADAAAAAELAAACPPAEREESGILQITSAPWVWRGRGDAGHPAVVAACGYQVWDGQLAQLSVLVHPDHRGRGLGRAVAAAAVHAAVTEGLIPQWRARASLLASRRIALALGFAELGWQAVYRIGRSSDP